jgi:protoporphyrinogen oxidase
MEKVDYLVVGAGVTGLSFANFLRHEVAARGRAAPEIAILEADHEPGGYCKTVARDGFIWDYSGHFFHFKHPEIEAWLRARMPGQDIRTVEKRSFIRYAGRDIDFPFQKNIHQLPQEDFIDCLVELYFRNEGRDRGADAEAAPRSFQDMLYRRFGRGIAERFLIPYNEKLYACDLDRLDVDAMGRFFPHADIADIIRNMRRPDNGSYNATFTYPLGGAIQYIHALLHDLPPSMVAYGERLRRIDLGRQVAQTSEREIEFRHLITSAPFPQLAAMSGLEHDASLFSWNKVLVFNLGFDRKGPTEPHWLYVPDRERCFYRVGFYDNIMDGDRMSLYVEIGADKDAELDVDASRRRVIDDLRAEGIVDGHELVAWHSVVLDPAYVHITRAASAEKARLTAVLNAAGVYPAGRYGGWTYCSIEDNMLEARELATRLAHLA